jgi:NAD(P)-dependent dehydrogenase (short-subunit alcohol dehydrogenase family)
MMLADKVAVVTGGTGALGSVVAKRFVKTGAKVVATYRSEKEKTKVQEMGAGSIRFVKANLTEEADVLALFKTVVDDHGGIDIVVNTVGGYAGGKNVADVTLDEWEKMMAINLRSTFLCTREALKHMKGKSYGRVVNIGAMTGLRPGKGKSAYAISKAGVIILTEIASEECKGTGITVNAIAPSILLTQANIESMPGSDTSKWVALEDVAEVIFFLCSEHAVGVTGTVIRVDGGV